MEATTTPLICTVGHSTHPLDAFVRLLRSHMVTHVLDVRTIPRSRRNPQFDKDSLPVSLEDAAIAYTHLPGLGGLRRPRADSVNLGWRNPSFRGYADYMQTEEFVRNIEALIELAKDRCCALMCAEAVPWRCHRSLIADALTVRGLRVEHIINAHSRRAHVLTPWARVDGVTIVYPPEAGLIA